MIASKKVWLSFVVPLALWLVATPALAAAPYNCDALDKMNLKSNAKAYSEAVEECVRRGWEPPPSWKVNDGVNPGIRSGGSGGISNNTVTGPEATGNTRASNTSTNKDRLKYSCDFPPRVKLGIPPKLDIPKGSCWDLFSGLLKDDKGTTIAASPPAPGINQGLCPIDHDTTGAFGSRSQLVPGAASLSCGGAVPLTSSDLVLNANPTGLATTEEGSYAIWFYRKSGTSYAKILDGAKLPSYLCTTISVGESGLTYKQKTIDLTPPIAQMITYDANAGRISIRLQSRASMNSEFIPAYVEDEPERYLIIPIGADGTPQIPADCDEDTTHFQTLSTRQDILIQSSTVAGCQAISTTPTATNDVQITCANGGTFDQTTAKCTDINGATVAATITNNWKLSCPSGDTPVDGKCPEAANIPAAASCANASTSNSANINCSTTSFMLDETLNASCAGKTQYSLLDRPNLYYPPGSTPMFYAIEGRTAFMADTLATSRFYTQGQTSIRVQATAPALTLNEGGMIKFTNGTTILMDARAVVDIANKKITLPHGGQLVGPTGDQITGFAEGATYTIPADAYVLPLEIKVESSLSLPAGYSIPTMVKIGSLPPYVQLPAAAAPK